MPQDLEVFSPIGVLYDDVEKNQKYAFIEDDVYQIDVTDNIINYNSVDIKTISHIPDSLLRFTRAFKELSYNPKTQEASIMSIPRDTYVGKKDRTTATSNYIASYKINTVFRSGTKIPDAIDRINDLTGLELENYVIIDTKALIKLVDAIGGVTFNVPIDMYYTEDTDQNLYIDLKAGEQLIDGAKAEQLLRFRHNNDGSTYPSEYGIEDYGRMKTQRNFLKALAKQTLKVENILKINEFIDIAQKYVETNIDFNIVKDYIPYIVEFNTENLRTEQLPGASEYTNGVWIYAAEEQETAKVIDKLFLNPELQDEEIDTSSVDTTGIDKSKIKIEVLNGSGSSVKLEKIENRLKKAGYTNIQSSETSSIDNSIIIKRGNVENAAIDEMKLLVQTQRSSSAEETDVDVTIILGKDE